MKAYEWLTVDPVRRFSDLVDILDAEFDPPGVVKSLQTSINAGVKGVLIERGYIDKDYRSTYYHFYAKKGRRYRDDCVRLHFFDGAVSFSEARTDLVCADKKPSEHYYGYVVLRPTLTATIGRSLLSPDIRTNAQGLVIQAAHPVHLLGRSLEVNGFPSMSQHADISVCAHVSCWSVLRHYSEKYPQYRELLMHDITKMAQPFDPGGLTPSLGLNVAQAERIFQAAGSYPLIVSKRAKTDLDFYVQLLSYLESGFPLFIALGEQSHAIVAIGHVSRVDPAEPPFDLDHVWSQVGAIVTIDDNHLPYRVVPVDGPTPDPSAVETCKRDYSVQDFDSFIVPLPDKIFYPADAVQTFSVTALEKLLRPNFPMPPEGDVLRRFFVTTLSAFRRHCRAHQSELGDTFVGAVMRLQTAQFIWVVEYASGKQWAAGHIAARVIVDATASPNDPVPLWFAHSETQAIFFDRSAADGPAEVLDLGRLAGAPIGRMEQNLRPVKSRTPADLVSDTFVIEDDIP